MRCTCQEGSLTGITQENETLETLQLNDNPLAVADSAMVGDATAANVAGYISTALSVRVDCIVSSLSARFA